MGACSAILIGFAESVAAVIRRTIWNAFAIWLPSINTIAANREFTIKGCKGVYISRVTYIVNHNIRIARIHILNTACSVGKCWNCILALCAFTYSHSIVSIGHIPHSISGITFNIEFIFIIFIVNGGRMAFTRIAHFGC
jgi:hypothetical protein